MVATVSPTVLVLMVAISIMTIAKSTAAVAATGTSSNCTVTGERATINVTSGPFYISCTFPVTPSRNVTCVGDTNTFIKVFARRLPPPPSPAVQLLQIRCQASHQIQVEPAFLDAVGSQSYMGTLISYDRGLGDQGADHIPTSTAELKATEGYNVSMWASSRVSTRYEIRVVGEETEGELNGDGRPMVSILILLGSADTSSSESSGLHIYHIGQGTGEPYRAIASRDCVLIPCFMADAGMTEDPSVYEMRKNESRCPYKQLLPPSLSYDPVRGVRLDLTEIQTFGKSFFCCRPGLGLQSTLPSPLACLPPALSGCAEFRIDDPPDVVASPQMPISRDTLRLFATKEDNSVPIKLECSSWGELELKGTLSTNVPEDVSGWLEFNSFWERGDPAEAMRQTTLNLTRANYTVQQTRSTPRPRFKGVYETTLKIFDKLEVQCIESATGAVLYEWNVRAHNAGPLMTGPDYLKLVQEPLRQPGSPGPSFPRPKNETAAPIFQCYSGMHSDAKLQVIRCQDAAQCNLLKPCLGSDDGQCGSLVTTGTECLVEASDSLSCQEAQIPSPGALLHCTAGGFSYSQLRWVNLREDASYLFKDGPLNYDRMRLSRDVIRLGEPAITHELRGAGAFVDTYYTRIAYNFTCRVHPFWTGGAPAFFFEFDGKGNGNVSAAQFQRVTQGSDVSFFRGIRPAWPWAFGRTQLAIPSTSVVRIHCVTPLLGSDTGLLGDSVDVHVLDSLAPQILNDQTVWHFAADGAPKTIQCDVHGRPPPSVVWTRQGSPDALIPKEDPYSYGKLDDGRVVSVVDGTILKFYNFTQDLEGVYTCTAANALSQAQMEFTVALPPEPDTSVRSGLWIGVGSTLGGFALLLVPALIYLRHYLLERRRVLDKDEMDTFRYGRTNAGAGQNEYVAVGGPSFMMRRIWGCFRRRTTREEAFELGNWKGEAETEPFDENFEIRRRNFKIDKSRVLGEGAYGKVYAGTATLLEEGTTESVLDVPVAIKVPLRKCPPVILKALLKELKIMTYLQHENIVSLVRACTTRAGYGKLYILLELCECSMEQWLKRRRNYFVDHAAVQTNGTQFGRDKLVRWCKEVAAGMEFLAGKGVVHRDLAARNVLLTRDFCAKVSDFGLSRQLYGYLTYEQESDGVLLPIRWMAVECFLGTFSTESDVWAYGIFVWELFSLGEFPYTDVEFEGARHCFELLESGLRITEPHHATPEIFSKLRECWLEKTTERPSFTELKNFFSRLLASREE